MAWSKESRHARGYGTKWDKTRARILKRDNYLCQCKYCKQSDRTTAANQVDHIVSKAKAQKLGWTQDQIEADSNLQAINRECHKRKTIEEQGRKIRPRIGLDGYPIED